ncbi:CDP-diacylglycerol--serine O-phosphatidyltransferase [Flavobacteriales bacterium]|nr:CDP-diacylglycerol--serine O-phosphatidyltransferase [Flavobacteriales bacterium]
MNIKKHIPNFITILNLVCGVFAIFYFIQSIFTDYGGLFHIMNPKVNLINEGVWLILIATVLDFLDGFAARLLKVQSEIGAQLDSLADMVTFGVAPGFLVYAFCDYNFPENEWAQYFFILIPIFSALRLAKFNVDTEQTTYFKGLATPANAIFWIGVYNVPFWSFNQNIAFEILLIILIIFMSLLMTSNLRMFSLKLKNLKLEGDNIYRVVLILGAIVLTIIFGLFTNIMAAIPFIIIMYILLSIHYHYNTKTTK